ncbi:MAG: ParA family protein [Acetobacteraceae bacterium]|nr:ParA family protein [Acetobacteraceae bacterium]
MPVLTVASFKGGPGKTTVTQLLVGAMAAEGIRLSVIDADPNGAFSRWARNTYEGEGFDVVHEMDEERVPHLIHEKSEAYDLVVVDTAGFGSRAAAFAIASSDGVLVPTQAGEADVTEAERTVRLVEGLERSARRPIPVRVLFNRVRSTNLSRHAAEEVARARLPRLETELADLVAFGALSYSGLLPSTGAAARLVDKLVDELRGIGFLPVTRPPLRRRKESARASHGSD